MADFDIAIIGGGIAGASLAYFLGAQARVVMIEGEAQPGYHTTGRSAAFYAETYGGPAVQPLTTASKPFFLAPPEGFASVPLLGARGGLYIARLGAEAALEEIERDFAGTGLAIARCDANEVAARVPQLRPEWLGGGVWEPGCNDIEVAALHQGFLSGARRAGMVLMNDAPVEALERSRGGWTIRTRAGEVRATVLVNAAGAWGDRIAALAGARPLGLTPYRRTMVAVAAEPPADAALPVVLDAQGSFYFKPDAGRLWISPHDEIPSDPCDAQPEELDIAVTIDRFEQATTYRICKLERAWAGLRTFAPDRVPVYGFDAQVPGFFWCVGQGGFGIQTAPAAGALVAALLLDREVPAHLTNAGVDPSRYSPVRFGD